MKALHFAPPYRELFSAVVAVAILIVMVVSFHNVALKYSRRAVLPKVSPNYVDLPDGQHLLSLALASGTTVVIWGSCELTNAEQVPWIAHEFLPKKLNVPVFAFGHGGMQSLAIAAQMGFYKKYLRNAKQVVILSPEWFNEDEWRVSLDRFLEFMPTPLLAELYFESDMNDPLRERIGKFLLSQSDQLRDSSFVILALLSDFGGLKFRFYPTRLLHLAAYLFNYVPAKINDEFALYRLAIKHFQLDGPVRNGSRFSEAANWDSWQNTARTRARREITNSYGFFDHYYETIFRDQGPWPRAAAKPRLSGPEIQDFESMLKLLKEANSHPLFVIQALNPKAFTNVDEYIPLIKKLVADLDEAGMPILNLWDKDINEPGAFWGPVQTGDLSWLKIDRAILQYVERNRE